MDFWASVCSMRKVATKKEFVAYVIYELEREFGDILSMKGQDFQLFKDMLIENLSCDTPNAVRFRENKLMHGDSMDYNTGSPVRTLNGIKV
jgi:hypothetical protein